MLENNEKVSSANRTTQVLVIDDSPEMHKLIRHWLLPLGIELTHAFSGADGLRQAAETKPSLILLDYMMPECDGLEVLDSIKADAELRETPVIMITANNDRALISRAFAKGVCDYVNKPLYADEFKARIAMVLRNQALLADLKNKSQYDALTGLPNKLSLLKRLEEAIARCQSKSEQFAVMFIDLDRFKLINDSLGHAFGDFMLQQASQRLRSDLRRTDTIARCDAHSVVARLGGDEFVVLLESIESARQAEMIAQRVLNHLMEPYKVDGRILFLGASIGLVTCNGQYTSTVDLIRDADIAMYEAKESGRGCYELFDQGMRERAQARWKLDSDLRRAVELDQLYLVYQPLIDLKTGNVESVEALIRWQHPERGLIQPNIFIPLAEEMGLMFEIGQWVIQSACSQFAQWQSESPESCPRNININLSRQQLLHRDFVSSFKQTLRATGLKASQVHLELTETEMMNEFDLTVQSIDELRRLGTKIELDDFGTGYSSLACLHQIPLDVIKLDRSLISTIDEDGYLRRLTKLVIDLLAQTDIKIVAEGVETASQLATLAELGCHFGQGFLFSRPMQADKVLDFIAMHRRAVQTNGLYVASSATASPIATMALPAVACDFPHSHASPSM